MLQNRVFWSFVLGLSCLSMLVILVSGLLVDTVYDWSWLERFRTLLAGYPGLDRALRVTGALTENDLILSAFIALFSGVSTIALTFIRQIFVMRRVGVRILVDGYFNNFLSKVIRNVISMAGRSQNRVAIILPSFDFMTEKEAYWGKFVAVLEYKGFSLKTERTDVQFGRDIFVIYSRDGEKLPIFVDLPTTMTGLRKIIQFETGVTRGDLSDHRWAATRFYVLRDQFRNELEKYVKENDWGNLTFIEGQTMDRFEKELDEFLDNLSPPS
jgi:hypothetical protein